MALGGADGVETLQWESSQKGKLSHHPGNNLLTVFGKALERHLSKVWADLGKASLLQGVQMGARWPIFVLGGREAQEDKKAGLPESSLSTGAWAEYAVADESQVGLKPRNMSFQPRSQLAGRQIAVCRGVSARCL